MSLEPVGDAIVPAVVDPSAAPPPDPAAEPEGFLVTADDGTRLHFHDWGGPSADRPGVGVLLLPGLLQPAWSWAPVARRLRGVARTIVMDLRGQGLSDAPIAGYDLDTLAADAVAVAEGSGALDGGGVVVAGHGFGAEVAGRAAIRLGPRCAGVVLVDGGFERVEETSGVDVEEFLRGMDEPPEVTKSMAAWLDDRWAFDPESWDLDQERAARDAVVETAAGHVVRAVRPHVVEAVVRVMFEDDPAMTLAASPVPVTVLAAMGVAAAGDRLAELRRVAEARAAARGTPIRVATFAGVGHNLMRYRPAEVAAAIADAATAR